MILGKTYLNGIENKLYLGSDLIYGGETLQIPTGIQLDLLDTEDFTYYVSEDGTGSGLSDSTPMSYSDARTAISTMNAGESMGFRRSDTFKHTTFLNIDSSGDVGNPITFGAYGTGFRPKIDSTDIYTGTWTPQGANIWTSEAAAYNESNPRLKINGAEVLGTKIQAELGTLIPDRVVFWNDDTTDTIHLYSTTDPSLDEVMYMRGSRAVYAYEQDNLVFDGIEFIGGYYGALMLAGTNNIEVKNCKMGDMCASGVNITDYGATTSSNITVHDNDMNSSFPFDYRGGTVDDSETTERGSSDGVKVGQCFGGSIYNNTFFDWGHTGVSLTAGSSGEVVNNFTVYDNTFSLSALRDYGGGFTIDRDSSGHEVYNNTMTGCKSNQVNGYNNHFHHNNVINTRQTALYTYEEGFGVDMATYAGDVYDNIIEFNNITNAESGAIRLRTSGTRNSGHRVRNNVTENCGSQNNNISVELNYGTTGIYDVNFDDNNFYNANFTDIYLDADTGDYEDIAFLNASTKYGINANNVNQNPIQPSGSTPVLSDFRIEDTELSRVYFDADSSIAGMTDLGFVISGKTISSLTIDGDGLGGYFTVSTPFNWWDNNTIRLGGLDGAISGDGTVFNFEMVYINNNITEPEAATIRYVNDAASGGGDGTSDGSAWTISQANGAAAGTTVWIKAGSYSTSIIPQNAGTLANPIKYLGYQTTPGDTPDMGWTLANDVLDPSIMPVFTGPGGASNGIDLTRAYIIFKNLALDNYARGVWFKTGFIHMDNIISIDCSGQSNSAPFYGEGDGTSNVRLLNCIGNDGGVAVFRVYGDFHLLDGCWAVNNNAGSDYYVNSRGSNSIFRNITIERHNSGDSGHGMSLKSGDVTTEYCLVENVESIGMDRPIEARHHDVKYCVFRNFNCVINPVVPEENGAIAIYNGASFNVFDNIYSETTKYTILNSASGEDPAAPDAGHGNVIKNCVFIGQEGTSSTTRGLYLGGDDDGQNRTFDDNFIINCTFHNLNTANYSQPGYGSNNQFINCTFDTGDSIYDDDNTTFIYENTNFYNNGYTTPPGTNLTAFDPDFTNPVNGGDFAPRNDQMISVARVDGVEYDANKSERETTTTIGAIKDTNE